MKLDIRMIACFTGERHTRLYNIWTAIGLYWSDFVRVHWHANHDFELRHALMLNKMWEEQENRHLLFTESDFLPNLDAPEWYMPGEAAKHLAKGKTPPAIIACKYITRHAASRVLWPRDFPGGWWVMIDCDACPAEMDFDGSPDPCNRLIKQVTPVAMFEGEDQYPEHFGVKYPFGTHMFWSRHLQDDPRLHIGEVSCGEVQAKHDAYVDKWLAAAPPNFLKILDRVSHAETI